MVELRNVVYIYMCLCDIVDLSFDSGDGNRRSNPRSRLHFVSFHLGRTLMVSIYTVGEDSTVRPTGVERKDQRAWSSTPYCSRLYYIKKIWRMTITQFVDLGRLWRNI